MKSTLSISIIINGSKSQSQLVTYFRKNMGLEYMITLKAHGCDFGMKIYTSVAITEFILSMCSGL